MKYLVLVLAMFVSFAAQAKVTAVSPSGLAVLNAIIDHQADFDKFIKSSGSNTITGASLEEKGMGVSIFRIEAKNCISGIAYRCLGGGELLIQRLTTYRPDMEPLIKDETTIRYFK
jgi:hypothetical protein